MKFLRCLRPFHLLLAIAPIASGAYAAAANDVFNAPIPGGLFPQKAEPTGQTVAPILGWPQTQFDGLPMPPKLRTLKNGNPFNVPIMDPSTGQVLMLKEPNASTVKPDLQDDSAQKAPPLFKNGNPYNVPIVAPSTGHVLMPKEPKASIVKPDFYDFRFHPIPIDEFAERQPLLPHDFANPVPLRLISQQPAPAPAPSTTPPNQQAPSETPE